MTAFLQHLKDGEFSMTWDTAIIQPPCDPRCQGAVGRYGAGYGFDDHQRDVQNKYGIHKPGYVLPDAIELTMLIKNRKGFDYLCEFAQSFGYQKPSLQLIDVSSDCKEPQKLKRATEHNKALASRVESLVHELESLTNIQVDIDSLNINDTIATDQFFEWHKQERYPINYKLIEQDKRRIREIWYDSNIMRDC